MKNLRLFLFILAVGVFGILNTEMGVIGILPAISEQFGVTISKAGLLVSLFALVVAVAGPTMPLLFSRFNRKSVMLFVLAVFAVANLISAWTTSFTVLLLARIIPAFFHPVYCSLAFAAAADAAPAGQGPDAVGKVMIGTAAGMVVGVPVSNFLAATFSLTASLLFFAAVTAVAFVATVLWIPSMPVQHVPTYGSQLGVLKKPVVWQAILAVIFMNGSVFGVFSYLADYLNRVTQLDGSLVSLLLMVYGLANVIGSYFSGRIIIRWPIASVQAFPFVILGIYAFFMLAGTQVMLTAVLILIWGITGGINANMNQYWLTTAIPEAKAFANGLFLTAANIGTMAAAMLCGWLIDHTGTASVVWGGMAFACVSAVCIFWRTANAAYRTNILLEGELLMHKNVKKAMLSLLFCSVAVGTASLAGPVQAADFFAPLPAKTPAATDTTGHPDNFYQSDKVTKTAVTFNNIYDMKVAGNLFVPKDMKKAEKLPAIIVGHPMGAVKEQSSDLYAQKLAEKGFVTLAIDLSYWGQSEGQPRNSVNPDVYAEDFSAAADYLGKQSFVNRDKIGVLGICGSGSFVISAAKIDPRLKAVATVSMYNMGNANRWGLHKSQSVEQRKAVLEAAAQERWAEADGAPVKYTSGTTHAIDSTTDPIQKEFYDFYRTTRGSYTSPGEDPEHTTHPTLVSNVKFMNFYPFEDIETISPRPMLFITGDQAHSKEFSEDAYRRAGNPKELYYVKGAGHVDLYDKVDLIPWNKLTEFFTKYLKN